RYDEGKKLDSMVTSTILRTQQAALKSFIWVGLPTVNPGFSLLSLKDGLIPTETRVSLRVTRPYGNYVPSGVVAKNNGWPLYTFSTEGLAPKKLADAANPYSSDKQSLLDRIFVVPNPYYANSPSYEANRLDTRVRIINLPQRATVTVYSLDGTLIRKIDKDNNQAYVDWDIRNAKGLPIASGMYLVHVNAEGIGEKIIRWFGAMRPIDITQY
ncbi:MAG TPA: T9SS type A sorting domain-containing protein, partial [Flavipsychrobacter sp.]|nr:T9SS type A sorting domain-containing protein [Flavipsychrobacter sp.]